DPDVEPFDVTLDDWALPDDEISHGETPVEAAPVHDYRADLPEEGDDSPLEDLINEGDPFTSDFETWGDQEELRDDDVFATNLDAEDINLPLDTVDETPALPVDQDATDYLARARQAAIAASQSPSGNKSKTTKKVKQKKEKTAKPKKKRVQSATGQTGRSKTPILIAASAFAVTAAGAGAWIALRGKQSAGPDPAIATSTALQTPSQVSNAEAAPLAAALAEAGDDFDANAALEDELFDAALVTAEAPARDPIATLPTIPKPLTLKRAADEGNPIAQYQWGEARYQAEDYVTAADYIRRASQQGVPAAQYRLAKLHEDGLGVPRDAAEARSWTEKAARGGNIKAMHNLAIAYADGEGGQQSYAGAAEWFRKAADFGEVDSQYNLAILYENGLGISPSLTEALYWYEVAAGLGDESALANVERLRQAISLEEAQNAQRRAANWVKAEAVAASNGRFGLQAWQNGNREQVRAIQAVLNGLGYESGTPDGVAGPATRTAIREFQSDNGLATDGRVTNALVDALNAQVSARAAEPSRS
ncbi:MAG: SEL1-like repeat protein, partial [Pseudomonadota bacterium]